MLKLGLMREPVFPGGSPLPRVHIFPSKSDREPADTRLSCVNRKQIKCLAGKVEKKYLYLLFLDEHHLLYTGYGCAQACRRHDWRHTPSYSPRPITGFDFFFPSFFYCNPAKCLMVMLLFLVYCFYDIAHYIWVCLIMYTNCDLIIAYVYLCWPISVMFSTSHIPFRCFNHYWISSHAWLFLHYPLHMISLFTFMHSTHFISSCIPCESNPLLTLSFIVWATDANLMLLDLEVSRSKCFTIITIKIYIYSASVSASKCLTGGIPWYWKKNKE